LEFVLWYSKKLRKRKFAIIKFMDININTQTAKVKKLLAPVTFAVIGVLAVASSLFASYLPARVAQRRPLNHVQAPTETTIPVETTDLQDTTTLDTNSPVASTPVASPDSVTTANSISSTRPTSGPTVLPALPEFKLCQHQKSGSDWVTKYFNEDGSACTKGKACKYLTQSCVRELDATDSSVIQSAKYVDSQYKDVDCLGKPLSYLSYTVDSMAGQIRYNENTCKPGANANNPSATLLVYMGGSGNNWKDEPRNAKEGSQYQDDDFRSFENAGIRVVAVKWQDGVGALAGTVPMGWTSLTSPRSTLVINQQKRPAAVSKWVGKYLAPSTVKFGVAGTSGGSVQTSSLLFYDIERTPDYVGLHSGGGIFYDVNVQCGAVDSNIRIGKDGSLCDVSKGNCDAKFYDDPVLAEFVGTYIDYTSQDLACTSEIKTAKHDVTSLKNVPFSKSILSRPPALIGFLVNNGSSTGISDDMSLGAQWGAGMMRQLVKERTGIVADWAEGPGGHGAVMRSGDPSFHLFKDQVFRGLLN